MGKAPPAIDLKVIDHVDATARRWLAASPLMFAAAGQAGAMVVTLAGGAPGFAATEKDGAVLTMPMDGFDDPAPMRTGAGFGALFLLPGIGETLRINGRIDRRDGTVRVAVEECYVHCAKALIRSDFWKAPPLGVFPADTGQFVAASRFMALATSDAQGCADVSPKGDPAGLLAQLTEGELWFPDRPGNRRIDSFRNIIGQPHVAAVLLIPGCDHVATLTGRAAPTTDAAARGAFAVHDRTPAIATRIDELGLAIAPSAALRRARLWPAPPAPDDISPARMFAEHIRINKGKGLGARLASAVVSIPGLMQKGLDKDYKDNLY